MLVLIVFYTIAVQAGLRAMPNLVATASEPVHELCLSFAPKGRHYESYAAIVCGSSLPFRSESRGALVQTGLLHLIVVSGSHLILLETFCQALLRRIPRASILLWPLLLVFVFANRLQPPVLRAFLQLLLKRSNQTFNLSWRPFQVITASGLATLSFCRSENDLRSLSMSWIASLALSIAAKPTQAHLNEETSWLTNLRVYLLMIPALLPLATPHPVSIAYNTLLAPVFGWVLFPLALAAFVFPASATLVDRAWDAFYTILQFASRLSPEGWARCEVPTLALCVYLAFLSVLLLRRERKDLACA